MKTEDGRELGAARFQHWLDTGEDELPALCDVAPGDEPTYRASQLSLLDDTGEE